jgi:hypothetical protein
LIREGEMTILGEQRKTYWFLLFNDLLLWVKPQANKFKFKGEIDLHKSDVVSRSQTFGDGKKKESSALGTFRRELANLRGSSPTDIKNSIQIAHEGKMMSLHAKKDRDLWLKDLQRIVDDFDFKASKVKRKEIKRK